MNANDSPLNYFHHKERKDSKPVPTPAETNDFSTHIQEKMNHTRSMMNDIQKMQASIEEQIDKVIKVSGFSKEDIWKFLESSEVSGEKWEKSQAEYKKLEEKVKSALTIDAADLAITPNSPPRSKDNRKSKFTGARRNWLSTR